MPQNPFKPTAGKVPPVLIGRQDVIDDFAEGLDNGAGAPGRLMLLTGQRGYGKTVMLTELGRVAQSRGWQVVSETASEGLCERLISTLATSGMRLEGLSISPSLGVGGVASASLGGVRLANPQQSAPTLRNVIEAKLRKLPKGKGVFFTIDEAQAASMDDIVALATTLQHVIRDEDMRDVPDSEKHGVAFAFAALPAIVDDVVNDKVLTFLRRAQRRDLRAVSLPDVRAAYLQSVEQGGKHISDEDALAAARASEGYPYMVQLVGYYMWRSAERRGSQRIEEQDVQLGIADAALAFEEAVCAPVFAGLTGAQRLFVEAVAEDAGGSSRVSDIAQRTGRSSSWVSKYRASLLKEHVIESDGFGYVRLATPYLASYINQRRA